MNDIFWDIGMHNDMPVACPKNAWQGYRDSLLTKHKPTTSNTKPNLMMVMLYRGIGMRVSK